MEWSISDLLDGMEAAGYEMKETSANRAVSTERAKEIAMSKIHSEKKPVRLKRPFVLALAATLALALGVTALAAAGLIHFDRDGNEPNLPNSAFGTGVDGQDAYDLVITDESGDVLKTEHYPSIDRVDVDESQASVLDGRTLRIDEGITLGDYTFVLRDLVLDQNGIGVMTCEIDNPNGHGYDEQGRWTGADEPAIGLLFENADGRMIDHSPYVERGTYSSTHIAFVYYLTPFYSCSSTDLDLTLTVRTTEAVQNYPVRLSVQNVLSAEKYSDKGTAADISPIGALLTFGGNSDAPILEKMVIHYKDGSEYVVKGDDAYNIAVSSSYDERGVAIAFNRMVDVENISNIYVAANGHDTANPGHYVTLEYTLAR